MVIEPAIHGRTQIAQPPASVEIGTTLLSIAQSVDLDAVHHVVVNDSSGQIVGFVSSERIRRHLLVQNAFERARWRTMPIESLMVVRFGEGDQGVLLDLDADRQPTDSPVGAPARDWEDPTGVLRNGAVYLNLMHVETMMEQAATDSLTRLMNRAWFEARLEEEWNRAMRSETSLAVLLIDVDDFKQVNDTLGHDVGDQLLKTVARCLRASLRSYDTVARFGGDEFSAICLGCSPGEIEIPIHRIGRFIKDLNESNQDFPDEFTLSIGAAVVHREFRDFPPEKLLKAADEALYKSKSHGRGNASRIEFVGASKVLSETFPCTASDD